MDDIWAKVVDHAIGAIGTACALFIPAFFGFLMLWMKQREMSAQQAAMSTQQAVDAKTLAQNTEDTSAIKLSVDGQHTSLVNQVDRLKQVVNDARNVRVIETAVKEAVAEALPPPGPVPAVVPNGPVVAVVQAKSEARPS